MNTQKSTLFVVLLNAAVLPFAGCVIHERTTVYEDRPERVYIRDPGPPPVVYQPAPPPVVYQPAPPVVVQEPSVIVVRRPVPAPRVEVVSPRPGPRHVWVSGYWVAQRGDWVWVPGRWETPPRAGAVWVAPRYDRHGTDVHFSLGFWR